jgi:FkbM family methyltransferase
MNFRAFIGAALRGLKYQDVDYYRLLMRAMLGNSRAARRIRLRCGTIDYLDADSLFGQYEEIFAQRGYDFASASGDPVIVDCGGNIGLSVLRFARLYPRAQIDVYEADPRIAEMLRENLRRNGVSARIIACAVADVNGEVNFRADGNDGGSIVRVGGIRVPAVRLVAVLPPRVDLLKLDIEGAEFSVLRDLCSSGAITRVRCIVGEFHLGVETLAGFGRALSDLESAGFSVVFPFARAAPDLPGLSLPTPFLRIPDGRCLLHFYGWRSGAA